MNNYGIVFVIKYCMKKLVLLILLFIFTSCGTFVNVSSQPRVTHILAINDLGQEVQVPLSTFSTGIDPYFYNNWRFYWGNNWYWGYNWWFYFNDPYWRPIIYNFYRSHPVYYNQGYQYVRNNGYRGRNSIIYQNRPTNTVRHQNVGRTTNNNVRVNNTSTNRSQNVIRTQQNTTNRSQSSTRTQQNTTNRSQGSGRRG